MAETTTTTTTEAQAVLVNCANMAASGILIRGKTVSDDWQVHRVGCRDLNAMKKIFGRFAGEGTFSAPATLDELRREFNDEMGSGGSAGFEDGWDFDSHVTVKPCTRKS